MAAKFQYTIGRCSFNSISFDVYLNDDYSATIRPVKNANDFPHNYFMKFESLEKLESAVDRICGDAEGVCRVRMMRAFLSSKHPHLRF